MLYAGIAIMAVTFCAVLCLMGIALGAPIDAYLSFSSNQPPRSCRHCVGHVVRHNLDCADSCHWRKGTGFHAFDAHREVHSDVQRDTGAWPRAGGVAWLSRLPVPVLREAGS